MSELEPGQQLVGRGPRAATVERVADGVWLMRGGASPPLIRDRIMNVYFLEGDGGVTVFDAGVRSMARQIEHVGQRMGGIKRIVLGHAHPDHRGAAARVDAPVWCHEDEVRYAEADDGQPYTDFKKLPMFTKAGPLRLAMRIFLHQVWDAGAVRVEGTLKEGDAVAGFEVVHLPGHAPGQIALWRERDRLALSTDCFYMLDVLTGEASEPRLPLDAYKPGHGRGASEPQEARRTRAGRVLAGAPRSREGRREGAAGASGSGLGAQRAPSRRPLKWRGYFAQWSKRTSRARVGCKG